MDEASWQLVASRERVSQWHPGPPSTSSSTSLQRLSSSCGSSGSRAHGGSRQVTYNEILARGAMHRPLTGWWLFSSPHRGGGIPQRLAENADEASRRGALRTAGASKCMQMYMGGNVELRKVIHKWITDGCQEAAKGLGIKTMGTARVCEDAKK